MRFKIYSSDKRYTSIAKLEQHFAQMLDECDAQKRWFGSLFVFAGIVLLVIGIWMPVADWLVKVLSISLAFVFGYFGRQLMILRVNSTSADE